MKTLLLTGVYLLLPILTFAQFTISGRVTDAQTNGPLLGASIKTSLTGTVTDKQGNYRLTNIPAGRQTLTITYLGYESSSVTLEVQQDITRDFALQTASLRTNEVVITATRANDKTGTTFSNVGEEQIAARNFGQDLPYLLDQTPSVVVNSDAGEGWATRESAFGAPILPALM